MGERPIGIRRETRRLRNEDNFQSGPDLLQRVQRLRRRKKFHNNLSWGWRCKGDGKDSHGKKGGTKASLPSMIDRMRRARNQQGADRKVSPKKPGEGGCPGAEAVGNGSHYRAVTESCWARRSTSTQKSDRRRIVIRRSSVGWGQRSGGRAKASQDLRRLSKLAWKQYRE